MSEVFDFSTTEAATSIGFLSPGHYKLSVTGVELVKPDGTKQDGSSKTPYLNITFSGKMGSVSEKFYITTKAISRLQYLHEAWFGKPLDKVFDGLDVLAAYFKKVFEARQSTVKGMIVGGKKGSDGKVYPNLPYTGFVLEDDVTFSEGPFEVGSANYGQFVELEKSNAATGNNNVRIGDDVPSGKNTSDDFDSLPF